MEDKRYKIVDDLGWFEKKFEDSELARTASHFI